MKRFLLLSICIGLMGISPALADIIEIPADYPTVQQGLNAAAEHDTILVAEGTYQENLIFPSWPTINLVLASHFILDGDTSHISQTILDGSNPANQDSASVIYMDGSQDSTTMIVGLTITGGKGTFYNTSIVPPYDLWGGGCFIISASPIISHNRFVADSAEAGAGLTLTHGADAVVRNNEFFENYASYASCIYAYDCSPVIIENHIHDNSNDWYVGISCRQFNELTICDNYLHHNNGRVISAVEGEFAYISGNVISDNYRSPLSIGGAGIAVRDVNAIIQNNQFLRNSNGINGIALSLTQYASGTISGNLFQGNTSRSGGAGISMCQVDFHIFDNQFIDNYCPYYGAGIYVGLETDAEIDNNTFTGNISENNLGSAVACYCPNSCILRNNNIYGNSPPAIKVYTEVFTVMTDAINNWWGDPSGPYHPILNPTGLGDEVGDSVQFIPWLDSLVWINKERYFDKPSEFLLLDAHPNPFNEMTTISFELPVAGFVKLEVFDIAGRSVSSRAQHAAPLHEGWMVAGYHEVIFDGSGLASGIYICRLTAGEFTASGKMVLLK